MNERLMFLFPDMLYSTEIFFGKIGTHVHLGQFEISSKIYLGKL